MADPRREVFTPAELVTVLGRSRSWIEERCRDGRLPALRDGGRWILRRADLIRDGWLSPACTHGDAGTCQSGTAPVDRQ
jgi:excisionase family DNA binding protein